jgi:hypothetical protein
VQKETSMSHQWAAHRTRLHLIILAAIVAVAAVLAATTQAAAARPSSSHVFHWSGGHKPVIVLEHGAWADASSWDKVIRLLQDDGFTVYAPPNPLRGPMRPLSSRLHRPAVPVITPLDRG